MEIIIKEIAGYVALGVEIVGIAAIAVGSLEAAVSTFRVLLLTSTLEQKREVWMRYARWLIAGLTFQLAGDIVHSAIAPSWDDIGRLAAIAAIRTFLTYFLGRDMADVRTLPAHRDQHQAGNTGLGSE